MRILASNFVGGSQKTININRLRSWCRAHGRAFCSRDTGCISLSVLSHGPKRLRYSLEEMKALTISALM